MVMSSAYEVSCSDPGGGPDVYMLKSVSERRQLEGTPGVVCMCIL